MEDQGGQAELARPWVGEQFYSGKAFCLAFLTVWLGQIKTHETQLPHLKCICFAQRYGLIPIAVQPLYFLLFWDGGRPSPHYAIQAAFRLLGSCHPPASAS